METGIGGPFLQMAVFCEKVLQEKDGVMSAIRIVDKFIIDMPSEDTETPQTIIPKIDINIMIALKSGDFKGKKHLKIKPISPSGQELPGFTGPILLEGGDHGAFVVVRYLFAGDQEGIYWFEVELDGEILTKMPMHIIYQKMAKTSTTSQRAN
jgi:hypothetical protein